MDYYWLEVEEMHTDRNKAKKHTFPVDVKQTNRRKKRNVVKFALILIVAIIGISIIL